MSKPGKVLKRLCKRLGVRLTVKRGKKRVYKSITVLKRQCAKRKKKKVKRKKKKVKRRRRKFGAASGPGGSADDTGGMNINETIRNFNTVRDSLKEKMAIPGGGPKNLRGAILRLSLIHI